MRFDDLEIVDLNGDEEKILRFPSDNPYEQEENNTKEDSETEIDPFLGFGKNDS